MPKGVRVPGLEEAVRKYYPTMSSYEVADIVGVCPSVVWRCAKRLGIEHNEATTERIKKKSKDNLTAIGHIPDSEELRKRSESQKKLRRSESYRVAMGLPQRTRFHVRTIPKKTVATMNYLRYEYNYFYDAVEGMTLYYDSQTKRTKNEQFFADKYHLKFEQADE